MFKRALLVFAGILLFLALASCASDGSGASREEAIKSLVTAALDIQYEGKTDGLQSVYTKDFLSALPDNFYKDSLAPYEIYNYDYMTTLREEDSGELAVDVRLQDRQSSYIQIIHIVLEDSTYLVSNIEYDI